MVFEASGSLGGPGLTRVNMGTRRESVKGPQKSLKINGLRAFLLFNDPEKGYNDPLFLNA
jgi:hypothetical protein